MNEKTAIVGVLGLLLGAAGGFAGGLGVARDQRDWRASYFKLKERYKTTVEYASKEIDSNRATIKGHVEREQALESSVKDLKARFEQLEAK